MTTSKINYIGWLGNNNLGDEALYSVIQDLLPGYELEPYSSFQHLLPRARICGAVADLHSHVSVFGGGTLLPDDITWVRPAKYNYVFGAAMKDPRFRSKFDSFDGTVVERLKSFRFRFIGVRDNFSQASLSKLGIESEVIGDPVLSVEPSRDVKRESKRIGVNVGCDGFLWGGDQNRVVHELIHTCELLKENRFDVVAIPFSKQDLPFSVALSKEAGIKIFDKWGSLQSVADLIASCRVFIGQRLHSLVVSAATYTPFVCLEYRPKCRAFAETLGYSEYCVRTDRVTVKQTMEKLNCLLDNWTNMNLLLKKEVDGYRRRQIQFARAMTEDIASLPETAWQVSLVRERLNDRLFWDSDLFLRKTVASLWRGYNRLLFLRLIPFLI